MATTAPPPSRVAGVTGVVLAATATVCLGGAHAVSTSGFVTGRPHGNLDLSGAHLPQSRIWPATTPTTPVTSEEATRFRQVVRASLFDTPSKRPSSLFGSFGRGSTPPGDLTGAPDSTGYSVGQDYAGTETGGPPVPVFRAAASSTGDSYRGAARMPLQERIQSTPDFVRERAATFRDDMQDRVEDVRESVASVTNSISTDYIAPLTHLARHPSTIQYSAAMSARLSFFMAQQTVVSTTVGGKLRVDPIALSRALLAALAGGREEPILEALRIPEERITSTESYAWWSRNLKGIVTLMKREVASIESGEYLLPYDMRLTEGMGLLRYNPAKMLVAFAAYYRDELQRKRGRPNTEDELAPTFVAPGRYPEYFLATDDFLSAKSARTMDYDMESKMWGMGDAMHRRSIARIGRVLADKDPATTSLLDVGCGTGRFLTFVKNNFKLLKVTALDLSLFNLQMAKHNLQDLGHVTFAEADAEHMIIENESQDVITCNFVLSSMPPEAQANVINEMARTLKPGGKVIIVDAAQPEFDGAGVCTLDGLPSWGDMTQTYRSYLKSDLEYSLIKAGLFVQDKEINWVSKVLVAQKPPRLAPPSNGRLMGVGS